MLGNDDILAPKNINEVNTYLNLPSPISQPEKDFSPNMKLNKLYKNTY